VEELALLLVVLSSLVEELDLLEEAKALVEGLSLLEEFGLSE